MLRMTLNKDDLNNSDYWIGPQPDMSNKPIVTKHPSGGSSEVLKIYIWNDGVRESDKDNSITYVYKNIYIIPKGVKTRIATPDGSPILPTSSYISVEDASKYNPGTKLLVTDNLGHYEEVWVRDIQSNVLVVDRAKNGTIALTLPNTSWVEAKVDHVYLSLSGNDGSWIQGQSLFFGDILDVNIPYVFYFKITTQALKTQIKLDTYLQLSFDEYPQITFNF